MGINKQSQKLGPLQLNSERVSTCSKLQDLKHTFLYLT